MSLATAAEMMREFYAEGGELTEFSDRADEDFSEYELLPENLQVRLAKLQDFIASRAQQQPSLEAAAFFERSIAARSKSSLVLRSPPTRIASGARNPTFWKSRVSGWTSKRSISDFVKQVKGSSSHSIDHEIRSDFLFK
jgi:hypothetical protein